MNFKNPTHIQVGSWGTFNGARYRVAGRVVLGCDVDGERYYWNEFYLIGENGVEATLVHEVGDRGVEWRMFVLFEPEYPLSASEAARKRVGDRINLEGTDTRITLVDESRVYHIEGEAPEGVELGDQANYFNARLGKDMIVVSWTGDEVEYYRGKDLPGGLVSKAFDLRAAEVSHFADPFRSASSVSGASDLIGKRILQGILAVLLLTMLLVGVTKCRSARRPASVAKIPAPSAPLADGIEGVFHDKAWRIRTHVVVEISQVGLRFERHEYHLTDADGNRALLVCGLKPGDENWVWFTPLAPLAPLTPERAAALRVGETVNVDGWIGPITELFQAVNRKTSSELPEVREGGLKFGFTVQSGRSVVQARWDAGSISFQRGVAQPAKQVLAAFKRN